MARNARWIDSRQWSYDFDNDLPAGVRCTFTLVPGLKTLKGVAVESHPPFVFDTGGPAVIETRPWMGSTGVDEQQAFILVLDAEPVEQTGWTTPSSRCTGWPSESACVS